MFGLHNLQPLCGTDGVHKELTKSPFLNSGLACATNGHAILFVRDWHGMVDGDGPPLGSILEMPWIKKETVVPLADLRAFLRKDLLRETFCQDGEYRELVQIVGVTIHADLIRGYLPGGFGNVRLARCKKIDWYRGKEPPALRIRGDGWELIVMALVNARVKPGAVFPKERAA